jgi:hypothetical protein
MATSAYAAFVDRYNSLTGAPKLYTFDAPVSDGGTQVFPAYSVLLDEGTQTVYEFEHSVMEISEFVLMIYADTLAPVDAAVEIIKYNGGAIDAGLGMDFGALPTLSVSYKNLEVRRMREQRFAAMTGKVAQRIHGCKLEYRVTLYRTAAP